MGNICYGMSKSDQAYSNDEIISKAPAFAQRLSAHHKNQATTIELATNLNNCDNNERRKRWVLGRILAEGAFGIVCSGLDLDNGIPIAIKQVQIPESMTKNDNEKLKCIENEILVLKNINHPNIIKYYGTERTENALLIFLEYAGAGSIAGLLHRYGPLPEPIIKIYTRQVLMALAYLHDQGYVHRDIKGANILVTDTGDIKLADFGACKHHEQYISFNSIDSTNNIISMPFKSLKGTPCFMAPEVIKQRGYGCQADIWSVGCTIIEMATGKPPWADKKEECRIMYNIVITDVPPPFPPNLSTNALDLLSLCFERRPERRPSAAQLLKHSFLRDENSILDDIQLTLKNENMNSSIITRQSNQTASKCTSGEHSYVRKFVHCSKSTVSNQKTTSCRESSRSTHYSNNKDVEVCKHGMVASLKETFGTQMTSVQKLSKLYSIQNNLY